MNCKKCIKFGNCNNKDKTICAMNHGIKILKDLENEIFDKDGNFKFMRAKCK